MRAHSSAIVTPGAPPQHAAFRFAGNVWSASQSLTARGSGAAPVLGYTGSGKDASASVFALPLEVAPVAVGAPLSVRAAASPHAEASVATEASIGAAKVAWRRRSRDVGRFDATPLFA